MSQQPNMLVQDFDNVMRGVETRPVSRGLFALPLRQSLQGFPGRLV